MGKKTVTVCDVCGKILENDHCTFGPIAVGRNYNGEHPEDEVIILDLCPNHDRLLRGALHNITKEKTQGISRAFRKDHAEAVLALLIAECSFLWRDAS